MSDKDRIHVRITIDLKLPEFVGENTFAFMVAHAADTLKRNIEYAKKQQPEELESIMKNGKIYLSISETDI